MRVVVNQSVTLSPMTGIGHYAAELLRCLRHAAAIPDALHVARHHVHLPHAGVARRARTYSTAIGNTDTAMMARMTSLKLRCTIGRLPKK